MVLMRVNLIMMVCSHLALLAAAKTWNRQAPLRKEIKQCGCAQPAIDLQGTKIGYTAILVVTGTILNVLALPWLCPQDRSGIAVIEHHEEDGGVDLVYHLLSKIGLGYDNKLQPTAEPWLRDRMRVP